MTSRVLVAGGSGPIGQAIVRALHERGSAVFLHYRAGRERAERLIAELPDGPPVVAAPADLLDAVALNRLVADSEDALDGTLTAVVNAAWPVHGGGRLAAASSESLEGSLDGLRMHHNLCRAVLPSLRASAGSLVFLGGALAHRRHPGLGLYSLGKAAAESLCLTLALEEGRFGVRVNVVAPGRVDLGGTDAEEDPDFAALEVIARRRRALPLPTAEQVADVVAGLINPELAGLTGQVLAVTGGEQW